ncbi:hypothetical protein ABPG74_004310 [Tetrahymena malaccensis]
MNNKLMKKGKKVGPPPGLQQKIQQQSKQEEYDESSSESDYDPEFEHPDDAEDFEDYRPEGYHPTILGEKFKDGRYTIVQKLGWGHFSTVWLAYDKETDSNVALKIQKSKKSYQEAAVDELQLLGDLRKNEKNEKWLSFIKEMKEKYPDCTEFNENEQYCVKLLDNFVHFGVHGKHYCSTFEIMGPNLLDLIQHFDDYKKNMKYWLVRQIARQCLIGLVYLHDVCGMIHTDLKPENVMLQLNEDYYHQFIEQVKKLDKKPMSMYYLKKQQQKQSKQNAKKDKKKEKKKKKKQEAAAAAAAATAETQATNQIQDQNSTNNTTLTTSADDKVTVDATKVSENKELHDQKQQDAVKNPEQNKETTIDSKNEEKKQEKAIDLKENQEQNNNKDNTQTKSETNSTNKQEQEKKILDKEDTKSINKQDEEKKEKENDSDYSDCESDSDKDEVSEEELYTLKWKNKIPIALDKSLKIKIVDFGNACWINKKFTNNIQTREYRAPETILGIDYQQNTDVFSFACMIYELITNDYLFKPKKRDDTTKNDEHLALFQESLGKFNKQFALSGTRSREFFNKSGQLIRIKEIQDYPISRILISEYDWDTKEALDIEDFLLPMLHYNPSKRIQAREALQSPWLWQQ